MSLYFPLGIARAVAASGARPDQATVRVSLGAGLAIGLAPFALGALADGVGTHLAFLLVPVLLAAAAGTGLRHPVPAAGRRNGWPMAAPARFTFTACTDALTQACAVTEGVAGLVLLGSAAEAGAELRDEWSDHDFYALRRGREAELRDRLPFLPSGTT